VLAQSDFIYSGEVKTVGLSITNPGYSLSGDIAKTNAGNYTTTVTLNPNYEWADGGEESFNLPWKINIAQIAKPVLAQSDFTYSGEVKTVGLSIANPGYSLSGDIAKTDAGNYTATVTLTNTDNYKWTGGGEASFNLPWEIKKASGLGTVTPSLGSKAGTAITIAAVPPPGNGQTVEYAISTINFPPETGWQNELTFSGLSSGTSYYIFARTEENANCYAGVPSYGLRVTTDAQSPVIAKQQSGIFNARVHNGTLLIGGLAPGKPLSVYTLSGTLIHSGIANGSEIKMDLRAKGIYIVKYETRILRVVNR
jgi:hypothetical protein